VVANPPASVVLDAGGHHGATEFRDGRATRFQVYLSWEEALKAVGLEG
jgi:hypothetical protein